jgi:hypothetical protein
LARSNKSAGGTGGCLLAFLIVMAFFVIFWMVAANSGVLGNNLNISMPDYRNGNARSVNLTAKGNKLVDSFYKEGRREAAKVKAFVTTDDNRTVVENYLRQTGYNSRDASLAISDFPPNSVIYFFEKPIQSGQTRTEGGFIIITGKDEGLVQDQKPNETYIILAEGTF